MNLIFPYNKLAFFYMIIAAISIAFSSFFAKLCLAKEIPLSMIIFSRFSIPLFILLCFLFSTRYFSKISIKNIKIHALRAIFLILSQVFLFLSMKKLSLSEAVILYSTGSIFIAIFDSFLENSISPINILSLIFGAAGVCLMLNIQNGILNIFVLIGLASGLCLSVSQILLHRCSRKENSLNIMFFVYLFATSISFFICVATKHQVEFFPLSYICTSKAIAALFLVGIFSLANQFFRGKAYSLVKMPSVLSPLIYFSIFFSALLDMMFFKQLPHIETIFGGCLVLFSSYLSTQTRIVNS
jgi:drug/metabolite transporter (DMT)-like permease